MPENSDRCNARFEEDARFQRVMQSSQLGTFGSLVVDSQGRYVDSQEKFVFSCPIMLENS